MPFSTEIWWARDFPLMDPNNTSYISYSDMEGPVASAQAVFGLFKEILK